MSTISENLQTIKNSTDAIKQAIIDKGGTISGDITTWADAISGIEAGGGESIPNNVVLSDTPNEDNAKIFRFFENLLVNNIPIINQDAVGGDFYIRIQATGSDGYWECGRIGFENLLITLFNDGSAHSLQ